MFEKEKFKSHLFRSGKQTDFVKKKVERFNLGLAIECKYHGEHFRWRLHSDNNVQCKDCALVWQSNQRKRNPLRFLFRDAKAHAKAKNRLFDVVLEDLYEILESQNNQCALTGILFSEDNLPSLDRIDSEIGYIKENLQFVCIKVNIMKSKFTQIEFIELCRIVVAYSEAKQGKKRSKKK